MGFQLAVALFAIGLSATLQGPTGASAKELDAASQTKVVRELGDGLARLEEHFSKVRGQGTYEMFVRPKDQTEYKRRKGFEFEFWLDDAYLKFECPYADEGTRGRAGDRVYCVGRDYAFYAVRPNEGQPLLRSFGDDLKAAMEDKIHIEMRRFVWSPFSISGFPFSKIMKDPSFKVTRISEEAVGPKKLLRIEYDYSPRDSKVSLRSGWIVVSPDDSWAIQEFLTDGFAGGKAYDSYLSGRVEYKTSESRGGAPIPARVVEVLFDRRREIVDFQRLTLEGTPENEFRLSAVGLPEIEDAGPGMPWTAIWLGVSALFLLLTSLGLLHWSRCLKPVKESHENH